MRSRNGFVAGSLVLLVRRHGGLLDLLLKLHFEPQLLYDNLSSIKVDALIYRSHHKVLKQLANQTS